MFIKRDKYLDKLKLRMRNGLIKVITGIRRSGKSFLLFHIFKEFLLNEGVDQSHIITLELDLYENRKYTEPSEFLLYIRSRIIDDRMYYILIDEVQMLSEFEAVLNSLLHISNADVYVTGSNSKFLSRDVITEFRGRGDEVHIYPLSFSEFMQIYPGSKYEGWADYIVYGGLPLTATMSEQAQKSDYLLRLFEETYIKDIISRYRVDRIQELGDLVNVLASSVGSLTNPTRIEATFKTSLHSDISLNTIRQYIEYLKDAFIVNEAFRYDVKGRKYIGTPLKYYFEDVGLRNARLGFRQIEESHLMENVIYNELRARDFQVDVGIVETRSASESGKRQRKQLEIDFIANQGSRRYYIQSALSLPDEEKVRQEKASLINIPDSFKKIIVVKDIINVRRDEDGITTMSIYDFLLDENSLES